MNRLIEDLRTGIRDVPDFPRPGVIFKDIAPLLSDHRMFLTATTLMARPFLGAVDKVVGVEARGFILGAPVAQHLEAGFIPVRKRGKLPGDVHTEGYALEYGSAVLEVQRDALRPGDRVLVVDDVLATGGTARATVNLIQRARAVPVSLAVLVDLRFPEARERIAGIPLYAVLEG
ncbi:MAG: adenine phosphoribosyltransferase [Micromonosporaceae bacterium]|nr:adenine phosphoribosyltransferase [Micromonosporaceae bacterium]